MASSSTFDPLEEQDEEKPKAMSIQVMEPKKDIDHVTYQVMTKVSLFCFQIPVKCTTLQI
jgi:hypothetical protein